MSKTPILLILFVIALPVWCFSQTWQKCEIGLNSGEIVHCDCKLRNAQAWHRVRIKSKGEKKWLAASEIEFLLNSENVYRSFILREVENVHCLAREVLPDKLHYLQFKDEFCLCDNSHKTIEAYMLELNDSLILVRKKNLGDKIELKPEILRIFNLKNENELPAFSDFPKWMESKSDSP